MSEREFKQILSILRKQPEATIYFDFQLEFIDNRKGFLFEEDKKYSTAEIPFVSFILILFIFPTDILHFVPYFRVHFKENKASISQITLNATFNFIFFQNWKISSRR